MPTCATSNVRTLERILTRRTMKNVAEAAGLREGGIYLDVDGSPVRLVRIVDNVCCWVPVGKEWNDRQQTLASYFTKRFRFDAAATSRSQKLAVDKEARRRIGAGRGPRVLGPDEATEMHPLRHRVGERVAVSGIYRAVHERDVADNVILLADSVFPYCAKCGVAVQFEFLTDIPARLRYRDLHAPACEITHPETGDAIAAGVLDT